MMPALHRPRRGCAPIVWPEESPQCRPQAHTPIPLARRLPEGDWGERREAGIQWIQPPKAVSDPEFRQTTSGAHGSASRADRLPRGKPPARSAERFPCGGLTRRLRRGLGLAVPWGAHTFLSVAKEKCAKESQRHGDSRGGPPRFALRPSPALRLCLATRFMAFSHFWR